MNNPEERRELGRHGSAVVHREFSDAAMAEATLRVYREWLTNDREDVSP